MDANNFAVLAEELNTTQLTPPLDSFHLFASLAPELRIKIWSFCTFPRTVTLQYNNSTNAFTTTTPPPILLSICQESRHEALKLYQPSFSTSSSPGTIYFSPYQDTIYLPRCRQMGYDETLRDFRLLVGKEESGMLDNVMSVAIDHVDLDVKRPWEGYNKASFIRSFPSLEEVILLVSSERNHRTRVGRFNEWRTIDGMGKDVVRLTRPKIEPEVLVRIWAGFRRGFVSEENALERVCESVGREYTKFTLPSIKMMEKVDVKA